MNPDCNILNPLQRDGTSQNQRLVRALHPSTVLIDERGIGDMLIYARDYARLIRYYSQQNRREGDWREFIECDISTLVAIIRKTDLEETKEEMQQLLESLRSETLANKIAQYDTLFSPIQKLASLIDHWHHNAVEGLKLKTATRKLIQSVLNDRMVYVIAHSHRAVEVGILSSGFSTDFLRSDIWALDDIQADPVLWPSGTPVSEQELDEAMHRLELEFEKFYDGLSAIQQQADTFLEETLNNYPEHEPHMALFLSFLQLFSIAQDHLNTLTRKHLNFYYKEVLQLDTLPAVPDEVHLVLELAKTFFTQELEQGTAFKAGKDDNSVNLFFNSDAKTVLNRTKLAEETGLRTVYLDKDYGGADLPKRDTAYTVKNIYAAPVANSADGLGADIEEEDGKWLTMGGPSMPYAKVGFAIASPIFRLQEASRDVTVDLFFDPPGPEWDTASWPVAGVDQDSHPIAHELCYNIKAYYSGEEEWVSTAIQSCHLSMADDDGEQKLRIRFSIMLDGGDPAVAPYDDEVLQSGLKTTQPVFKFIMDNDGLAADFLCFDAPVITAKTEAETVFPAVVQQMILNFLNAPETSGDWVMIAGREPEDGPVFDNVNVGPNPGYDIGETVARNIINVRNGFLVGGAFTHISQLYDIPGLGVDKFNDLYATFCASPSNGVSIAQLKAEAQPFKKEKEYLIRDVVSYKGDWYTAVALTKGAFPSPTSVKWALLEKSYPYRYFQQLSFYKMELSVEVSGISNLVLENDVGVLNPAKPFLPFGPVPKIGSKFYIGYPEAFRKRLVETYQGHAVVLDIEWADLPQEGFSAYYLEYDLDNDPPTTSPISNNHDFEMEPQVLSDGDWGGSTLTSKTLFSNSSGTPSSGRQLSLEEVQPDRLPEQEVFANLLPELQRGFMRFELEKDFLHKVYPAAITNAVINSNTVPNAPYTPTISTIKMTYRSKETVDYRELHARIFEDRYEQLFHIEPFGWKEIYPITEAASTATYTVTDRLVPEFLVTEPATEAFPEAGQTDAEGSLYIGLDDLIPEQNVSILFQMAEGSADPDKEKQEVIWSYLSGNQWHDFKNTEVLSDATNGLLNSGIITFAMSKALKANNTSLPGGTFWIKGSVARQTPAISKILAVMPQALKATFAPQEENDLNRLSNALPAETISKLKTRLAAFKAILQPFSSFNGQVAESAEAPDKVKAEDIFNKEYNEFYIRVSERLRHKNRGITIWDYERIVLQQFPEVYKVKCINHTRSFDGEHPSSEHAPGHVKLIVLPNLRNKNAIDPLEPKLSLDKLEEVKNYVQPLISDFVELEVKNPQFEQILVSFSVQFLPGKDKGFYAQKLNEDIVKFLSPWLHEEGEDLALGGKIHRSVILNFIEETDYVDFLTDFQMDHIITDYKILKNVEEARASTSSSVLVSALQHQVKTDLNIECKTQPTY